MKRLLTILVVAFFFVTTTINAKEEGTHNDQQFVNPQIPCNQWDMITHNLVNDYQEFPVADGTSALTMQDGTVFGGTLVFFVNKDTSTYTVVVHFEDVNLGCVIGAGENFAPAGKKYLELLGAVKM